MSTLSPRDADASDAQTTLLTALKKIADGAWTGSDGKRYRIAEPSSVEQKIARVAIAKAAREAAQQEKREASDLLEALHEGRRAIGDHSAPRDCYATGPLTGNAFRDLVQCPACSFIAKYDAVIAKGGK